MAWVNQEHTTFGTKVKRLHSDGGGEFCNTKLEAFCSSLGILQNFTLLDSSQQNGIAESRNHTLVQITRCLLSHSHAPLSLWGYALYHAALLYNLYPHPHLPDTTPTTLWLGKTPTARPLRIWGCTTYVLLNPPARRQQGGKLGPKTQTCIYLGHNADSPDYLFLNPSTQQLVQSRDVIFDETRPFYSTLGGNPLRTTLPCVSNPTSPVSSASAPPSPPSTTLPTAPSLPSAPITYYRRSNPQAPPPPPVPSSTQEPALPQSSELITYQPRPLPPPKTPKPSPPFTPSPPSSPVAHGTQSHGAAPPLALAIRCSVITPTPLAGGDVPSTLLEDRHEELCDLHAVIPQLSHIFPDITASPSLNFSENPTIPIPLIVQEARSSPHAAEWRAAMEGECEAFTCNNSFDDESPPPGVNIVGSKWLFRLNRSVYGLKEAPREWHNKVKEDLLSLDIHPSSADPTLFIRRHSEPFYILVYVDDFILVAKDSALMISVQAALSKALLMKDLGDLKHFLGMEITCDREARTISLSQEFYINNVLKRFEMELCTPMATPLALQHLLSAPAVPTPEACSEPYPELVGSLIYAIMCIQPNLAYPVSVISRYVAPGRFTKLHWSASKWVMRYPNGTMSLVLTLGGPSPPRLEGYTDSSWADDLSDRCSFQGYGFTLGSGVVSWCSTRSSAVSLSSCEAELNAGTMVAQVARWLTTFFQELGYPQPTPTLWCDNKSTIHLSQDPLYPTRTKHIELRHFFIRDLVQHEQLNVDYVASDCNLADLFSKPLGKFHHHRLLGTMGLCAPRSPPFVRLTPMGGC
ncbi:unnamed protein product [Closterium sp. NIES-54]